MNNISQNQIIDYNTEKFKTQLDNFIENAINQLPISNVYYTCNKILKELQIKYYMNLNKILAIIDEKKQQQNNNSLVEEEQDFFEKEAEDSQQQDNDN